MHRNSSVVWLVAALSLAAAACDDDEVTPPTTVPGDLAVTLTSPHGPEAAAVFETSDPGIVEVAAESGIDVFNFESASGRGRIVALLEVPGTIAFTLSVEDVNDPPRLEIVEVADLDNRLRDVSTGYELRVVPIEPETGSVTR